jgi:GNAT superfamily N-acetyltransferase
MDSVEFLELGEQKSQICRDILNELPEWFGIPESVDQYVAEVERLPVFGLVNADGLVVAFLAVKKHFPASAEAYVLGVRKRFHRTGLGRRMFHDVEEKLMTAKVSYLTVKTLGPTLPNARYETTRLFYEAIGFVPLEEFPLLWGAGTPCLFMVKSLI